MLYGDIDKGQSKMRIRIRRPLSLTLAPTTTLVFEWRNAPATLQRALDDILSEVWWKAFLVYIEDVVILSENIHQHVIDNGKVLKLLRQTGVP